MYWIIPSDRIAVTREYVQDNMPAETTFIQFPPGVKIGEYAFNGCTGLIALDFPEDVPIGSGAFNRYTGLTELAFPLGTQIDAFAFAQCTGLTELYFSLGTHIARYAFKDTGLRDVDISKSESLVKRKELSAFCLRYGLEKLRNIRNRIYRFCHRLDNITQSHFKPFSNLSVSSILSVIQAYYEHSRNVEQSKQLLKWVMGSRLVDQYDALEVGAMIATLRGDGGESRL
jgi:hypothetical protein